MSEYLTFNKSGQWELHKATNDNDGAEKEPKSDYKPGSKKFQTFGGANLQGDLPKDFGQKGNLHDTGGGVRPKNQTNWEKVGKPIKPMESQFNSRNPGVGD